MKSLSRLLVPALLLAASLETASAAQIDWNAVNAETLQHFQAIVRMDTSGPQGNETQVAEYLRQVLEREGLSAQLYANDPNRANLVVRVRGSGRKRPLLLLGHTDVVAVDPSKWTHPPFSAEREGGHIYGRGTLDDKSHVVANLMTVLLLKRQKQELDRDVIFLAEAGEEGSTQFGIAYMVQDHFPEIDAEYCLAEGGQIPLLDGKATVARIVTSEKSPRRLEVTARGMSSHGARPTGNNAVVRLARAIAAIGAWRSPVQLNETTRALFTHLAQTSPREEAELYRAVLGADAAAADLAADRIQAFNPPDAAILRNTLSPTLFTGGLQVNVVPSEARALVDVRLLPGVDDSAVLQSLREVVNDPEVQLSYSQQGRRPASPASRIDTEAYRALETALRRVYGIDSVPMMMPGATDMSFLRDKGMQCYGTGAATEVSDSTKGFALHGDQERIIEAELYRLVRLTWEVTRDLARAK